MRTEVFKDTRLLDALEFIDDEYIASAARYKMKYTEETHEHKMTWRTPLKHSKIYVALVASLILLAIASPMVNFITYVVSNFTAGAGRGTTEQLETIDSTETEEALYLQFTPELEPISKELIEEVKDAHCVYWYGCTRAEYIEKRVQEEGEEYRNYVKDYLESIGPFQQMYKCFYSPYYGTFNDCLVLACIPPQSTGGRVIEIAGYKWDYPHLAEVYAYSITDKELCNIEDAYDKGWLRDEDIGVIAERHVVYEDYYKENFRNAMKGE